MQATAPEGGIAVRQVESGAASAEEGPQSPVLACAAAPQVSWLPAPDAEPTAAPGPSQTAAACGAPPETSGPYGLPRSTVAERLPTQRLLLLQEAVVDLAVWRYTRMKDATRRRSQGADDAEAPRQNATEEGLVAPVLTTSPSGGLALVRKLLSGLDVALNGEAKLARGEFFTVVKRAVESRPRDSVTWVPVDCANRHPCTQLNHRFHVWLLCCLNLGEALPRTIDVVRGMVDTEGGGLSPLVGRTDPLLMSSAFLSEVVQLTRMAHDYQLVPPAWLPASACSPCRDLPAAAAAPGPPTVFTIDPNDTESLALFNVVPQPVAVMPLKVKRKPAVAALAGCVIPPPSRADEAAGCGVHEIGSADAAVHASCVRECGTQTEASGEGPPLPRSSAWKGGYVDRGVNTTSPSCFMTFAELLGAQEEVDRVWREVRDDQNRIRAEKTQLQQQRAELNEKMEQVAAVLRDVKQVYCSLRATGEGMEGMPQDITARDIDERIPHILAALSSTSSRPVGESSSAQDVTAAPPVSREIRALETAPESTPGAPPAVRHHDVVEDATTLVDRGGHDSTDGDGNSQRLRICRLFKVALVEDSSASPPPQPMIPYEFCSLLLVDKKQLERSAQLKKQRYQCAGCRCQLSIDPGGGVPASGAAAEEPPSEGVATGGVAASPLQRVRAALEHTRQNVLRIRKPRRCHYCGAHFCHNCHHNKLSVIPSNVFNRFDFTVRHVCNRDHEFISRNYARSFLHWHMLPKASLQNRPSVQLCAILRKQLYVFSRIIAMCTHPSSTQSTLLRELLHTTHFSTDEAFYSLKELEDLKTSEERGVWSNLIAGAGSSSSGTAAVRLPESMFYWGNARRRYQNYLSPTSKEAAVTTSALVRRSIMPVAPADADERVTSSTSISKRAFGAVAHLVAPHIHPVHLSHLFQESNRPARARAPRTTTTATTSNGKWEGALSSDCGWVDVTEEDIDRNVCTSQALVPASVNVGQAGTLGRWLSAIAGGGSREGRAEVYGTAVERELGTLMQDPSTDLLSYLYCAVVVMEHHLRFDCPVCAARTTVLCSVCQDRNHRIFLLDGVRLPMLDESASRVAHRVVFCSSESGMGPAADSSPGNWRSDVCETCNTLYHAECLSRSDGCPVCAARTAASNRSDEFDGATYSAASMATV